MSGALCALWIGLVSIATACLVKSCPSLAPFLRAEGATPSWLFLSDHSLLNFEGSAASQGWVYATPFQLAVRWENAPSPIMPGGVRAPHILLQNSLSSMQSTMAARVVVENSSVRNHKASLVTNGQPAGKAR